MFLPLSAEKSHTMTIGQNRKECLTGFCDMSNSFPGLCSLLSSEGESCGGRGASSGCEGRCDRASETCRPPLEYGDACVVDAECDEMYFSCTTKRYGSDNAFGDSDDYRCMPKGHPGAKWYVWQLYG